MRLVQLIDSQNKKRTAVVNGDKLDLIAGVDGVYQLAREAIKSGQGLADLIKAKGFDGQEDYQAAVDEKRLLNPIDHPDPAHCIINGTGLTHLGSAKGRNAMHQKLNNDEEDLTDSMKIFKWGLEGGKPEPGKIGFQPEWFYKGDAGFMVAPEQDLIWPSWGEAGGEEAEVVGIYIAGDDNQVYRVGFCLGNEFSDHVMEKKNYLNLSHSKMRNCSMGPELLLGDLPRDIKGTVKLMRGDEEIWQGQFLTGEDNMSHAVSNLEHHHFKYPLFRRAGDVHCHFFGASILSFSHNVLAKPGDVYEIEAKEFGRPLRNKLVMGEDEGLIKVKPL